jgi:phage terminase large subunit GpA-like protein
MVAPPPRAALEDPLSLAAYRLALAATLQRNFAPWTIRDPFAWAEQIRRLPDDHGATRPFSFEYAPYQREMYAALFEPRNQEVVFQLFSRGGKSEVVLNALGYLIHERPCRIGVMWPVEGDGKLWSKDDFMGALIGPTPELLELIPNESGRRRRNSTLLHKQFPGGSIQILGANAPGRVRRVKARFLYADEIDAIETTSAGEGDILAIFKKRASEFADRIEVYCSYPKIKRQSRIEAKRLESDDRHWFVTCPLCGGEPFVLHRPSQLRFDPERPHEARLECPRCRGLLTDSQRHHMARAGFWRATRPFTGKAGFHAGSLLWPHNFEDPAYLQKYPGGYLHELAQQVIDAERADNPEHARMVLVNTCDAETYERDLDKKPEHTALYNRREKYDPREVLPEGVLLLTLGGDIQKDRGEFFILGWGEKSQSWGIDHWKVTGSPLDPAFWEQIDKRLEQAAWKHPSGHYLRIAAGLIDCNYKPDETKAFTRRLARRQIFASRGSTQLNKPITGRPKREGKPPVKVYELGTHKAKDILYQRLDLPHPTATGYKHYPAIGLFDEAYFKQLTIENSEMRRANDGEFYRFFFKEEGDRNEAIDGEVYALAAERLARNGKRESDFYAKLKANLTQPASGKPHPSSQPASESPAPTPGQPHPPRRFVQTTQRPGRGGFVGGWKK